MCGCLVIFIGAAFPRVALFLLELFSDYNETAFDSFWEGFIGFLFLPMDPATRPPLTVGAVNLVAFGVVICMTLITTPWGVKLAHAMDPKPLKRAFAVFLVLVALNMLRKALGW